MNRTLKVLFLITSLLAAAGSAEAKVVRRGTTSNRPAVPVPKTVIIHMDQLPQWVQNEGVRMLHSRHRTAYVKDMLYVGDFPDTGDVVRLTQTAIDTASWFCDVDYLCGQGIMPIGSSSPRHYDPRRTAQIMSEFYNAVLGPPRADMLAGTVNGPDEPYNGTIRNFRPGVLLVFYEFPPDGAGSSTPPSASRLTVRDTTVVMADLPKFWFRPSIGGTGTWLDPQRILTPTGYLVAGTRFGAYHVGGYVGGGQDFQPTNAGTASAGVQFGDELGLSFRVGYRSTWDEFRGDGHTSQRSEGIEAGIGIGYPAVRLGLNISTLYYSNLGNRTGDYYPAINLGVDFGPVFRWN